MFTHTHVQILTLRLLWASILARVIVPPELQPGDMPHTPAVPEVAAVCYNRHSVVCLDFRHAEHAGTIVNCKGLTFSISLCVRIFECF